MIDFEKYYSTREIMSKYNCGRANVSKLAQNHKWRMKGLGQAKFYLKTDVDSYYHNRKLQKLASKVGLKVAPDQIARHSAKCPDCEAFAIENSVSLEALNITGDPLYSYSVACENGHFKRYIGTADQSTLTK